MQCSRMRDIEAGVGQRVDPRRWKLFAEALVV
jgi:hypothetical protein